MSAGATIIYAIKIFFILMAVATVGWMIIASMFRPFRRNGGDTEGR